MEDKWPFQDESDALDAEIVQLLRAIEGEKEKENVFKRVVSRRDTLKRKGDGLGIRGLKRVTKGEK